MAITQFIGGQAVVLSGSSVLADPATPPDAPSSVPIAGDDRRRHGFALAGGDVRP
ncbi:MAG: hypothetical protein ACKOEQ_05000 [Verrucomicrobiota bacterium]